jgi:hypothetical protein
MYRPELRSRYSDSLGPGQSWVRTPLWESFPTRSNWPRFKVFPLVISPGSMTIHREYSPHLKLDPHDLYDSLYIFCNPAHLTAISRRCWIVSSEGHCVNQFHLLMVYCAILSLRCLRRYLLSRTANDQNTLSS